MAIQKTKNVVRISTDVITACERCTHAIGGDKFADSINHYINAHGYKLLHVGSETLHGSDGKPWHTTVAVAAE
jgi:hypothetical protein